MNTKVGKSYGLRPFGTRGSSLYEPRTRIRTLLEQGRPDLIMPVGRIAMTMASASESAFNEEEYMRWAPKLYHHIDYHVWSPDFWMMRNTDFRTRRDVSEAERVYKAIWKEQGSQYTPVRWTTIGVSYDCIREFPLQLLQSAGRNAVPLYYFAVSVGIRTILYARTEWLETFKTGSDLINYYRIASRRNFKKVYGF